MKRSFSRSVVGLAVVCLVLSFGQSLFAAAVSSSSALLEQAYTALHQADHDYKGHRVAAMKQIEAAAKLLGTPIPREGQGKGHEKQVVSDTQLRTAQGLLEQAKTGLSGKPLNHVQKALEEIAMALKVK